MDLIAIDRKISELSLNIDFYAHLTPLNLEEEKRRFFEYLTKCEKYNPVFKYKKDDFSEEKKWLRRTRESLNENDTLESFFAGKIDYILNELALLSGDDRDLVSASSKLFGLPDDDTVKTAMKILEETENRGYAFPDETVSPEKMAAFMKEKIAERGVNWKVDINSKIITKITISARDKTVYINPRVNYTRSEVQRLEVHELDAHIFRGANGEAQGYRIFMEGLAGYNETEEGLAIYMEELSGCHKIDTRQVKLYAGRALAVKYSLEGSFYDAFTELCEFFPDYMAYRLVERVKRGMKDTSLKGCITKGFHYISGWRKIHKFIEEDGDLSILYVGKIGLDDISGVKELLKSGVLKSARFLPDIV